MELADVGPEVLPRQPSSWPFSLCCSQDSTCQNMECYSFTQAQLYGSMSKVTL